MKITVKELRQIIKEELISIKRGNRTIFYDAEIDKDDNIVNFVKKDLSADLSRVLEVAEKYTTASPAEIINAVSAYTANKGELFKKATSLEEIQANMEQNWLGTLKWKTPSRIGKGEAAVHIAFAANENVREPDFVSADGSIKISIKYAGEGDTSVRSADTASKELSSALENFRQNLSNLSGENFEFPSNNFTPKNFGQVLATILRNKNDSDVKEVIENLTAAMEAIKKALITEHGAQAILVFTNGGVSIIDSNNIDNIHLLYIKNGNRVEYFCTPVSSQDSYDNILKNFKNPVNYRKKKRIKGS